MWMRMKPLFQYIWLLRICIPVVTILILFVKLQQNHRLKISRLFFLDLLIALVCILFSVLANPGSIIVALFSVLLIAVSWLILAYLLDALDLKRFYGTFINLMCLNSVLDLRRHFESH